MKIENFECNIEAHWKKRLLSWLVSMPIKPGKERKSILCLSGLLGVSVEKLEGDDSLIKDESNFDCRYFMSLSVNPLDRKENLLFKPRLEEKYVNKRVDMEKTISSGIIACRSNQIIKASKILRDLIYQDCPVCFGVQEIANFLFASQAFDGSFGFNEPTYKIIEDSFEDEDAQSVINAIKAEINFHVAWSLCEYDLSYSKR